MSLKEKKIDREKCSSRGLFARDREAEYANRGFSFDIERAEVHDSKGLASTIRHISS